MLRTITERIDMLVPAGATASYVLGHEPIPNSTIDITVAFMESVMSGYVIAGEETEEPIAEFDINYDGNKSFTFENTGVTDDSVVSIMYHADYAVYGFADDKSKVEVCSKDELYSKDDIIISTEEAPATGTPNTFYLQIITD